MKTFIVFLVSGLGWLCIQAQEVAKPVWRIKIPSSSRFSLPPAPAIDIEWVDTNRIALLTSKKLQILNVKTGETVFTDSTKGENFYKAAQISRLESSGALWMGHREPHAYKWRKNRPPVYDRDYIEYYSTTYGEQYIFNDSINTFTDLVKLIGIKNNASEIYGDSETTVFLNPPESASAGLELVFWDCKDLKALSKFELKDSTGTIGRKLFPPQQVVLKDKKVAFVSSENGVLWRLDIGSTKPTWTIALSKIERGKSYWSRGIFLINDSTLIRVSLNVLECVNVLKGKVKWVMKFQPDWIAYSSDAKGEHLFTLFTSKLNHSSNLVKIRWDTGEVDFDKVFSFEDLVVDEFTFSEHEIILFGTKKLLGVIPTKKFVTIINYENGNLSFNPIELPNGSATSGSTICYKIKDGLMILGVKDIIMISDSGKVTALRDFEISNLKSLFNNDADLKYVFSDDSVFVFNGLSNAIFKTDSSFTNTKNIIQLNEYFSNGFGMKELEKLNDTTVMVHARGTSFGSSIRVTLCNSKSGKIYSTLDFPEIINTQLKKSKKLVPNYSGSSVYFLGASYYPGMEATSRYLFIQYTGDRYFGGNNIYVISKSDCLIKSIIPSMGVTAIDEARRIIITQTGAAELSLFKF